MEPRVILPLSLFLALASLFLVVLQRASQLIARTREHERFQQGIADLDRRLALTIDPLVEQIDGLRRHTLGPDALAEPLAGAAESLRTQAFEARALRAPIGLADVPAAFLRQVERAERAVGLAEHGRSGLVAVRGGPRELEAQTSLKRASLNLRHAREAADTIANRVAATPPPGGERARERRRAQAAAPVPGRLAVADPRADDGPDPSM